MPDLLQFNQNTNLNRVFKNKSMNLDIANLRKRKLLHGVVDDLGRPASKHKYCEAEVTSECETSSITVMASDHVHPSVDRESDMISVLDTQMESPQDSNSFLEDAQSENVGVTVDACFKNMYPYDEASSSWDNSKNGSGYTESNIIRNRHGHKEEERYLNEDTRWHDIDGLEECISTQDCEDSCGQTTKGIHEFLSATGVDPTIFTLPPEETEPGTHKPTIDQEFEQYFSTLML